VNSNTKKIDQSGAPTTMYGMRRPQRDVVRSLRKPTRTSSSAAAIPPAVSSAPTARLGMSVGRCASVGGA